MTDIFLSYDSADRERIRPLVNLLEEQGWSVWWDRKIPPGKTYDQVIEQALDEARCVIVVWSQHSVQSEWVKGEADEGMNRKILVPVQIEEARIPLAFRRIQAARLVDWQGEALHSEFAMLFESVTAIVGERESREERTQEVSLPPAPATPVTRIPAVDIAPAPDVIQLPTFDLRPEPDPIPEPPLERSSSEPSLPSLINLLEQKTKRNLKPWLAIGAAVVLMGLVIVAIWKAGGGSGNKPIEPTQLADGSTIALPATSQFEFDVATTDARGNVIRQEKKSARYYIEEINGVKLEIVEIPGGTFTMGSPDSEAGRSGYEGPRHEVTIPPFFMGKYEVTQAQWREVAKLSKVGIEDLDPDPSKFIGDTLPVEKVSWYEVREFCRRLAKATGREYRLPSEAEWEYAARAGTTTPFAFGPTITPSIVNYNGNYPYGEAPKGKYLQRTVRIGSLGVANSFGLFDMHGNVWEWSEDDWHRDYNGAPKDGSAWVDKDNPTGSYRVIRGGGWSYVAFGCRSAFRGSGALGGRSVNLGFRLVRAGR